MKKSFLVSLFVVVVNSVFAQQLSFSDSSVISLITCSPGEEVYAKFGHTGIRIVDPQTSLDVIFNYGIFSFETENFYYKFIKGETDYYLGVSTTSLFLSEYKRRNSMVWEQVINLTLSEKRNLINALLENYQPENRKYRYNFIFDNCATRPRVKIINSIDGFVSFNETVRQKTFRQWVGDYVGEDTWVKFGIDMVFGMDADVEATQLESMFLPEILMNEFQSGKVTVPLKNETRALVAQKNVLVSAQNEEEQPDRWYFSPLFVFGLLFSIGIVSLFFEYKRAHYKPVGDSALLLATGLIGVIIFYLMFVSTHPLVKNNLNLLWANPLNLIAAVLIWMKKMRKFMFVYQVFNLALLGLALVALALSIQSFNVAVYPILALLIFRYARWFVRTKHKFERKSKYLRMEKHKKGTR